MADSQKKKQTDEDPDQRERGLNKQLEEMTECAQKLDKLHQKLEERET